MRDKTPLPNLGNPYCDKLPILGKVPSNDNRPRSRYDQLWCWFFYLDFIQNDPSGARFVLDNLDKIPTFKSNWDAGLAKNGLRNHRKRKNPRREPKAL